MLHMIKFKHKFIPPKKLCILCTIEMLQHANANAFPFLSSFFYSGRRHSALTLLTPPGKVCREARKWRSSIEVCNPGWRHVLKIHDVYTSLKKLTPRCKKEKLTQPDSSCSTVLLEPTKDSPTCLKKLNKLDEYWGFVEVRLFSRKPIFPARISSLWLMFALHWESLDSQKVTFEAKYDAEKELIFADDGHWPHPFLSLPSIWVFNCQILKKSLFCVNVWYMISERKRKVGQIKSQTKVFLGFFAFLSS